MSELLERNMWEDHITPVNSVNLNKMTNKIIANSEGLESVKTNYQTKNDSTLKTSSKTIVGAINEIKDTKYDNVEISGQEIKFYVGSVLKKTISIPTASGKNGKEIELRKSGTHIEWNYVGENNWKQLVALSELKVKGDTGATPSITIGEVTTLEAGQKATVTKSGTNESPIFNFGIPKGQNGTNGQSADLSNHQTKRDEALRTTDKTVVGSINEIFQKETTLESKLNEALNKITELESKHPES